MNSPVALLAQRFSDRLNQLLDQQGVPITYHSRCAHLGRMFSGETSLGVRLLDGRALPDWVLFTQVCSTFEVEPGYFLDPQPIPQATASAEVVVGATGGDSILWCAPQGLDSHVGKRKLSWLSGKNLPPNVLPTDIVIFDTTEGIKTLTDKAAYVIEMQSGYLAKNCSLVSPGKALFCGDGDIEFIVQTEPDNVITTKVMKSLHINAIFPVVGTMRMAKHFVSSTAH